jgi:prephenate dehydrogenase
MTVQPVSAVPVRNLVVIGLGLIGGSLAKGARERGVCSQVWGVARSEEVCARAKELGIVDEAATSIGEFASRLGVGDVIFIAVPTLSVKRVLEEAKSCISADVTITDGASVKGSVLQDVQDVYGVVPPQIVLGHPIAGSEKSGVEAANPNLYVKHRVILTPTPETGVEHLQRVTQLWQAVGAEVLQLKVIEHDEILGATSHLPHAIAFSLVDTLAHDSQNQNIFRYAAGGFRDFTRIASSDAVMWRDIMLANDRAIIKAIDLFSANLARLRTAVEQNDAQTLLDIFSRAKAARDQFSQFLALGSEIPKVKD